MSRFAFSTVRRTLLAASVLCASASAVPFSWNPVTSEGWAGGSGPGGGSSGSSFPFFFSFGIGGGSNGASGSGVLTFNASGVRFDVGTLHTNWYQNGQSSQAWARGRLVFTPTVPNLSYSFNGFMNVIEEGLAIANNATCDVELHPDYPHPPSLYTNNVFATGAASLWNPATPQFGTQIGNLIQGQQYVMNWRFTVNLTGGTDPAAVYAVKLKNNPFFQFLLYQRPCPGDLNGDGYVDDSDFTSFAAAYDLFDCADPLMPPGCPSDLNGDGFVDDTDFVLFAQAYENLFCP